MDTIMKSFILSHMESVEQAVKKLTPSAAFTFGAACVERSWPIYELAAHRKDWDRRSVLRGALDAVWRWLSGRSDRPLGLAVQCNGTVVDEALPNAYFVANNVFGLLEFVEENEPCLCHLCAQTNLNLVVDFVYSTCHLRRTQDDAITVANHELCKREMKHQSEDIQLLLRPFGSVIVDEFRNRSYGQSIFGNV
jgi:hypothetical protein